MAGPWEKYQTPAPTGAPVTIGSPDPYKAEDQALQREAAARAREAELRAREDQALQREKFAWEKSKEEPKTDPTLQTAIKGLGLDELLFSVKRAKDNLSGWSTGLVGSVAGNFPGTERRNLIGNLEALKGGVILEKLQALREASKTGASGMGALSEKEGDRLAAAVAALDPDMSQTELETSLNVIERHAKALKAVSDGFNPEDPGVQKRYGIPSLEGAAPEQPAARKMTPEEESEFIRILRSQGLPAANEYARKTAGIIADPATDPRSSNIQYEGGFLETGKQILDQAGNIIVGGLQGAAALPDMAAKTVGGLLAVPVEAAGFTNVAEDLRHPFQFGEAFEEAAPTPPDTVSRVNRVGGQIAGGIVGFPGKAANSLVTRIAGEAPTPIPPNALGPMAAATRQNIQLIPADVGGATTRRLTAGAVQSPYGAGPVIAASERSLGTAKVARDRIASEAGKALPEDEAGEVVRAAANVFSKQTSARGARLYEKAHNLTNGAKVAPTKAIQSIDDQIAELSETPELNQTLIRSLEKLKSDFAANGGVTVAGLRNMRTALRRESMTEGLRGGDTARRFGMVLEALKDDIATGIPENARQAFLRADQFWAKRVETIDNVLEPVLGKNSPKSGEDVFKGIEAMAQGKAGGAARFRELMSALPAEEAATVRATVISRLGQAKAGNQDAAGAVFSPAELVTQWNKLSAKGKATLFGNGELRQALDDLAEASGAMKAAGKYANTSNTAGAISANLTNTTLGGAAVALFTGHPLIAAAMTTPAISQRITGKLMASPKFVRWLARTPKDPGRLQQHLGRLTAIAESNPAIGGDIQALQQAIIRSLSAPAPQAGRLAASPDQGPQDQ